MYAPAYFPYVLHLAVLEKSLWLTTIAEMLQSIASTFSLSHAGNIPYHYRTAAGSYRDKLISIPLLLQTQSHVAGFAVVPEAKLVCLLG